MKNGLVHIYCGDGKGKTTAAVGLAVRMAGSGGRVLFFQFLKNNTSSERRALEKIQGVDLMDGLNEVKFTFNMTDSEKAQARRFYENSLLKIQELCENGAYDMIVLDEVVGAADKGFINTESVLKLIDAADGKTEIVMTGRRPCAAFLECADYVTEMKKLKHPFDHGIKARYGIEM